VPSVFTSQVGRTVWYEPTSARLFTPVVRLFSAWMFQRQSPDARVPDA
jgi:hypothetical protein